MTDRVSDLLGGGATTEQPAPASQSSRVDELLGQSVVRRGQYSDSVMGRKVVPLTDRANTQEVGAITPPDTSSALKYSTARAFKGDDDQAIANILLKALPESELLYDKDPKTGQDVPYLSYKGRAYYINKPGLSQADAEGFVGNIIGQGPAGAFAMGGKTLARQAGRALVGSGATTLAGDIAVDAMGGDTGVDLPKAGINAAVAPIAQVIGAKIFPLLSGKPLVNVFGNLTADGEKALVDAGIDPTMFTPQGLARLNDAYRKMGDSFNSDAGRAVAARVQTDQFDIPTTMGQQTGDVRQIAKEQAMRNYARGDAAGRRMTAFDAEQDAALRASAGREQGRLSGRSEPTFGNEFEAGATIGENVKQRAADLKQRIAEAYEVAASKPLEFKGVSIAELKGQVEAAINAADVTLKPDLTPASLAAIERVKAIKNSMQRNAASPGIPGGYKTVFEDVDFRDLETVRRQLNGLVRASKNDADRRGVKVAIDAFDEWVDSAVERGLTQGDPGAIKALKDARALRAKYGRQFEERPADADAGKIMDRLVNSDVTPNEVANLLIGYSEAGLSPTSTRVAKRLKDVFGSTSPEWNQVRELALLRIVNGPKGTASGPQAMVSRFDKALEGQGMSFMRELFTPEELARLRQFRGAVSKLVAPANAGNPSRSGYEVARMFDDIVSKVMGTKAALTADPVAAAGAVGMKAGKAAASANSARSATQGVPMPPGRGYAVAPGIAAGGVGEIRRRANLPDDEELPQATPP